MTKSTGRYLSVTSTMLSLFLLLSTGILHPVQADEYRTAQFDIVSQPLGSALVTYSEQANVQVVVAANAVTDLYSNQVAGRMDISSALSEMLRKTDLNHEFSGDTVAITAETAGAAKQSQQPQQREERRAAPPQRRPGDQSQGPGDGALALEEIVVTAEKRAVSLQRTAISLTAFTDERITQSAIEDIYDIGLLTPGVIVNKEIVGKIYIRGIGTENLTIGGDPGVAVHVDGAYVARTSAANFELFDTERVEVLRGPQGTLYGRNATGGSINIISKAPTDEPYARGEVQYGDYDRFRIGATANAPLSDKVYARANVVYSRRDGFTPNLFTGQDLDTEDLLMGRLRLRFLPSDNVTIDLIGDFAVDDSRPAPFKQLEFSELFEGLNGAFDPPGLREVSQDSPVVESQDQFGLTGIVTWDFADTTLTSISSFRDIEFFAAFDGDATDILFQNFADTSNSRQFTQELQLASATDDRLSWLAGLYYFNDSGDTTIFIPIPGFGFDILHEATISTDAFAAFGQATYDVSDRFSATLGLCYSVEGKDAFQFTDFGFIPPIEQPLEENSDAITPRFALEFTPNEETLMYASVTRGFKSGGFTFNGFQGNFEPEFVWAYEAGYKTRFADDRVQANLSGFYYDYTDLQVSKLENNAGVITNAADATIWGGELELAARPAPNFEVNAGLAYLNAEFDQFLTEDPSNPQLGTIDLQGNRLTRSPKFTANLGGQLSQPIADWGSASVRVDYQYQSKSFFTPFNRDLSAQDSFSIVNARVALDDIDGKWRVAAFVKNLLDEDYFLNILESGVETGKPEGFVAPPRTWGVQLSYEF